MPHGDCSFHTKMFGKNCHSIVDMALDSVMIRSTRKGMYMASFK